MSALVPGPDARMLPRVYQARSFLAVADFVCSVTLALAALIAAISFVPASVWKGTTTLAVGEGILFFGLVVPAGIGLAGFCGLRAVRVLPLIGCRIVVREEGLELHSRETSEFHPWGDAIAVWFREPAARQGGGRRPYWYKLQLRAGKVLFLPRHLIPGLDELGQALVRRTFPALLWRSREALAQGQAASFKPIQLDREGLW